MGQVKTPGNRISGGFLCTIFCSLRSAVFLQMPDIIVVLVDRSVGGEVARLGDIDCHLLRPAHSVLISCQSLVLGLAVTLEVRECHERVSAQQLVVELLEKLPVQKSGTDDLECCYISPFPPCLAYFIACCCPVSGPACKGLIGWN